MRRSKEKSRRGFMKREKWRKKQIEGGQGEETGKQGVEAEVKGTVLK